MTIRIVLQDKLDNTNKDHNLQSALKGWLCRCITYIKKLAQKLKMSMLGIEGSIFQAIKPITLKKKSALSDYFDIICMVWFTKSHVWVTLGRSPIWRPIRRDDGFRHKGSASPLANASSRSSEPTAQTRNGPWIQTLLP